MKRCTKCNIEKEEKDFYVKRGRIVAQCKDCCRQANRVHYSNNKERYFENNRKMYGKSTAIKEQYVLDLLLRSKCCDCGETNFLVLEFDHVRGSKKFGISAAIKSLYNLGTLKTEIDKCEIVCSNCHQIRTQTRSNSRRYRIWLEQQTAL